MAGTARTRLRTLGAATAMLPLLVFHVHAFEQSKLQKVITKSKISENKSCRGAIDLQLSQRASYVLIDGFVEKSRRSCSFSTARVTVHSAVNPIFGQFALKIGMSANYEKCVPGNNEQLSYWPILNFYSEIWRTRKKTISALKEI
jgi:predicted ABC-type sugar transport system permease subunit